MKLSFTTLAALAAFLLGSVVLQAGQGMTFFEGTWAEALAAAKAQNKYIYMDCYTTWCGPCKYMQKNVFTTDEVGSYYNANFINVAFDMEKGEGAELAKQFGVQLYPTHLYFNPEGEIVHKAVGSRGLPQIIGEFIKYGANAKNPSTAYYVLQRQYKSGDRSPEVLLAYALSATTAYANDRTELAKEYFATQTTEELMTERNWKAMKELVTDVESREFIHLYKNKAEYDAFGSAAEVDIKIIDVALSTAQAAQGKIRKATWYVDNAKPVLTDDMPTDKRREICGKLLAFSSAIGKWDDYATIAVDYVEGCKVDDSQELNGIAWTFYESIDDKAMLEKAEKWAARSIELDERYDNTDTYAAVLKKLGKKDLAIKAAERAIEIAKNNGADYSATQQMLEEMQNGHLGTK